MDQLTMGAGVMVASAQSQASGGAHGAWAIPMARSPWAVGRGRCAIGRGGSRGSVCGRGWVRVGGMLAGVSLLCLWGDGAHSSRRPHRPAGGAQGVCRSASGGLVDAIVLERVCAGIFVLKQWSEG